MSESVDNGRILIVDDEEKILTILSAVLRDGGYEVATARSGGEALEISKSFRPHLVIADLQMPRMDGLETVERIKELIPETVAVILTAHGSVSTAVQAIKNGVYDYLTKPYDNEQLMLVVRRGVELSRLSHRVSRLELEVRQKWGVENIIGSSARMQSVRDEIRKIADADATVLIEGESGTGKELAARAIHYESKRRGHPLVTVDCAAIPSNLLESEFFGHERGAFTDAIEKRIGKFEEASGGSVFLDEIGELPLDSQTKLLRVLQEREVTRVGGNAPIRVDVRVICATNKVLEREVREGRFREDLYYRLNVLKLQMPSLGAHLEDIPEYVRHFIEKHGPSPENGSFEISDEALSSLRTLDWKGNVRQLENAIQRAMMRSEGKRLEVNDFFEKDRGVRSMPEYKTTSGLGTYILSVTEHFERQVILDALNQLAWNRTEVAKRLKISRKTLFNKMQLYGIGPGADE